ncbi:transposase [Salinispora arenicola]|uniref:transposase n=1 Tax=Salinispora arenicola TaxID=168697 RepID=UPI00207A5DA4|nr:transposase [Salinispora arenicola]MCN0154363.1 transposase [Salinispora arenicola]
MGSKQGAYDAEFREGAVRIVIETGKPIPEVAEELGVNPGTLHSWVSRWRRHGSATSDRPAEATPAGQLREAERAELERLRRETAEKNKRIRELERDDAPMFVKSSGWALSLVAELR